MGCTQSTSAADAGPTIGSLAEANKHPSSSTSTRPAQRSSILPLGNRKEPRHRFYQNLLQKKSKSVLEDYTIIKQIGEGSISNIFLVKRKKEQHSLVATSLNGVRRASVRLLLHRDDNDNNNNNNSSDPTDSPSDHENDNDHNAPTYALKQIDMELVQAAFLKEMKNEIALLQQTDHPHILRAYEVYYHTQANKEGKERQVISMILELCQGGDLNTRFPYTEAQARRVIKEICKALHYLHSRGIMHRDIKPENIMFENKDPNAAIKILDFGLAFKYSKKPSDTVVKGQVGTISTMSPEAIKGKGYDVSTDIWSLGVVAYELLRGFPPFRGKNRDEVAKAVVKGKYSLEGPRWKHISPEAKSFVSKCLQKDPSLRMTAAQALQSPWLKQKQQSASPAGPTHERTPSATLGSPSVRLLLDTATAKVTSTSGAKKNTKLRRLALQAIARKASTAELMELRQVFDAIDTNHNGTLTLWELKKGLGEHYDEAAIEEWFNYMDVHESGCINYTEFIAATMEAQQEIQEDRIAEAFKVFDTDDTGYITPDNLREILGMEREDSQYIEDVIREADSNDDGRISFREFREAFDHQNKTRMADVVDGSGLGDA